MADENSCSAGNPQNADQKMVSLLLLLPAKDQALFLIESLDHLYD